MVQENKAPTAQEVIYSDSVRRIREFIPFTPSQELLDHIREVANAAVKGANEQQRRVEAGGAARAGGSEVEREALNKMFRSLEAEFNAAGASYPVQKAYQNPIAVLYRDIKQSISDAIKTHLDIDYQPGLMQMKRGDPQPGPG